MVVGHSPAPLVVEDPLLCVNLSGRLTTDTGHSAGKFVVAVACVPLAAWGRLRAGILLSLCLVCVRVV